MTLRKTNPNTEFSVGQIVMTEGILKYGLCGWPGKTVAVNKSRLTLERLRVSHFDDEDAHKTVVRYAKSITYIADSEAEAFAFYEAASAHVKSAKERLRQLEDDIRKEGVALLARYGVMAEGAAQ